MSTEARGRHFLTDDRGAVMVMGIFMCSCLVASLWYLAGIGDAILYRERLQEAADAVAFSDAALHARGMNLIVLINLIMAVILSVRVALRVGKLVMAIAAAIFAGLGFTNPSLWGLSPPAATAAVALNNVDNATKPVIDGALQGLNAAQQGIVLVTPGLAKAGANGSVGPKYVNKVATIEPYLVEGLPLEKRRPDKLCGEAATVIPKLNEWFFKKAGLEALAGLMEATVTPLLESIASASPNYFCDLEAGATSPNTNDKFDDAAKERCENIDVGKEEALFLQAEKTWLDKCASFGATCTSRDARDQPLAKGVEAGSVSPKERQDELDRLRLDRDLSARSFSEFVSQLGDFTLNSGKCVAWAKQDLKKRRDERDEQTDQQASQSSSSSSSSSGVAPMLIKDFTNGTDDGQIVAGVRGDPTGLQPASKIVRIGAFNDKRTRRLAESEPAKLPAWAQAELFYDCSGAWKDTGCDGDDDAMWHFKWRARLRRFNRPADSTIARLAIELGMIPPRRGHDRFADDLARDVVVQEFKANAGLRKDLATSLQDDTTRAKGVH